jgi:hypothetical protein
MFQSVFTRLRALGARAASDLAAAHLRTQAVRIIRIASVAFAAQIATTGLDNAGWKVLAAVAVSAVEAGVRQAHPAAQRRPERLQRPEGNQEQHHAQCGREQPRDRLPGDLQPGRQHPGVHRHERRTADHEVAAHSEAARPEPFGSGRAASCVSRLALTPEAAPRRPRVTRVAAAPPGSALHDRLGMTAHAVVVAVIAAADPGEVRQLGGADVRTLLAQWAWVEPARRRPHVVSWYMALPWSAVTRHGQGAHRNPSTFRLPGRRTRCAEEPHQSRTLIDLSLSLPPAQHPPSSRNDGRCTRGG